MQLFKKNLKSQSSNDGQNSDPVDVSIVMDNLNKEDAAVESKEPAKDEKKINWFADDDDVGQLSVDVFEKGDFIIIKSTVAGVKPEDIEVIVDEDTVAIRGKRNREDEIAKDDCYYQECYWGSFERVLKLPMEVAEERAEAYLKNGVLTVKLAKIKKPKSVKVPVRE